MISIKNLSIDVGTFSLRGIDLEIETGMYGVLMGKTGCGKTTVLEAVCGLRPIRAGSIHLAGREVTRLKPAERGIGFVPQDGAIFTTMSVRENVGFALEIRGWERKKIDARVKEMAELLDITSLLDRNPIGLSGGERQRIALGRALAFHPPILCLDEPLSSLDHDTRGEMCDLLREVKERTGVTTLHITHNRNEAFRLADRFFTFRDGRIESVTERMLAERNSSDENDL